jgi:hypothetical protein
MIDTRKIVGWIAVLVIACAAYVFAESISVEKLDEDAYGTVKYGGNSSTLQGFYTADDLTAEDDLTVADVTTLNGNVTLGDATNDVTTISSLRLNAASLPTTTNGLTVGDVWVDSGALKRF